MKRLIINYLILVFFGMMMVYSTTYKILVANNQFPYKNTIETLIILIFLAFIALVSLKYRKVIYNFINHVSIYLFMGTIALLILVFIPPFGIKLGGAWSSINLVFVNLQPIEIAKITIIIYIAKVFSTNTNLSTSDYILRIIGPSLFVVGLIFVEPDLGGALLIAGLVIVLIVVNGKNFEIIIPTVIITIIGVIMVFAVLPYVLDGAGYQVARLTAWKNPFDPSVIGQGGENLIQGYTSISNGGIVGTGFLSSAQTTGYLFASSSDFIFTIIAEEFGILGVLGVLVSLFFFAYQIFMVGVKSGKKYEYLYCTGFSFLILIQTFINVGGVTGVIPMTGVTLPFISKGVNSFFFLSLGFIYVLMIKKGITEEKIAKRRKERRELFYE